MVKQEISASGTDSDDSEPQTPLAASTQKTPPKPKKQIKHNTDSSDDEDASPTPDNPTSETLTKLSSKTLQTTKERYLAKFPFVRPSKAKYCVDVDLTDSSDEVYIVKCPSSVDARKVLMGAKMESFASGAVSKISSTEELGGAQLEGVLTKNSTQKPVTIMAGTEFKSFVPVGTIQIRESLEDDLPPMPNKGEFSADEEIPFPEEIRERHPLLGVDFQLAQRLPKHVKKALSLAQQRSDAIYLQKDEEMITTTTMKPPAAKSYKRKRGVSDDTLDYVESADETITLMIKEEKRSPSPRKKKLKKENPTTDDDLSWLNEM